jgi:hypothetical protein
MVILLGAEVNAEMEHQTAQDTIRGRQDRWVCGATRWRIPWARRKGEEMTNLLKLPTWADDEHVFVVVETPRGSTCKLDFDAGLRAFRLTKPLMAALPILTTGLHPIDRGGRRRPAGRSDHP